MARREIKKMGAVLIAAGLSIAMCSPSVSANVRTNINTDKITQKKRNLQRAVLLQRRNVYKR